MKGLLEKDLRLITKRINYLVMLFGIMIFVGLYMEPSFLLFYVPLLASLFTITTISYDEFDNGMSFIMTLPIKPKDYVLEKYVLGICLGVIGWIISSGIVLGVSNYKGDNLSFVDTLIVIPIMLMILSVMLPVELKFGSEKSRIAILILAGICFVAGFLGTKILGMLGFDPTIITTKLDSPILPSEVAILIAITLVVFVISIFISMAIMNKKEY